MDNRWIIFGRRGNFLGCWVIGCWGWVLEIKKVRFLPLYAKTWPVNYYLCRLALCSRYFAFCLAEPEPWAPVMYFFFFALVLTFPSSCFGLVPPRENEMPLTRMSSKSFISLTKPSQREGCFIVFVPVWDMFVTLFVAIPMIENTIYSPWRDWVGF